MPDSPETHRVFIVNEEGEAPFVSPKVLAVARGDQVIFTVAGEDDAFGVCPGTEVFRSVEAGEDVPVERGSPSRCTVNQGVGVDTIHRYEVLSEAGDRIDPIMLIYE